MNPTMQFIITIFYVVWLCAVLALLYGIWRSSSIHVRKLGQTLIDVALKSADSSQKSAEAAQRSAEAAQRSAEAAQLLAEQMRRAQ